MEHAPSRRPDQPASSEGLPLTRACCIFGLVNLLVFAIYRVVFLAGSGSGIALDQLPRLLLYGARIDLALIGVELTAFLIATTFLGLSRFLPRAATLWVITGAHVAFVTVDLLFYAERNQHVGEQLMAFILDPREMGMAVGPFVQHNALTTIVVFLAAGGFTWMVVRLYRRGRAAGHSPVSRRDRRIGFALALAGCLLLAQPVQVKYGHSPVGWGADLVLAKHYMRFSGYSMNQAVVNPLHDLLFDLVPAAIGSSVTYTQSEEESLAICAALLGLDPGAATSEYPLRREIRSRFALGIQNVVIIQVEGLTESILEHDDGGIPVMPFLRQLKREGLYFTNAFQSFNDTVGSVFSTASSYHKACFEEQTRRLTTYELGGSFSSLPRVLPGTHEHFFYEGFRQSAADFLSFMGSQGFSTMCYQDFAALVAGRAGHEELEGDLGVYDGPVMDELARILLARGEAPFTAHLMTGTSHSPWQTPPGFPLRFAEPAFNAFAYFDSCLEEFLNRLRASRWVRAHTLFVIVADHTSITLTDDLMERIRVPLLFLHPGIDPSAPPFLEAAGAYACQVDVLPTILDLMGGSPRYFGMGQSLLDPAARGKGAISGSRARSYYIKDGFVLSYTPRSRAVALHSFDGRVVDQRDASDRHLEVTGTLLEEYMAQYELGRRLAVNKRVAPPR